MPDSEAMQDYVRRLRRLTTHVDPLSASPDADEIRLAGNTLDQLPEVTEETLRVWVQTHPRLVYVLGLAVGLSREKLQNQMKAALGTSGWIKLARTDPAMIVKWLEDDYGLLGAVEAQRRQSYTFGDVLAARGTSRQTATSAGVAGKSIEDSVEEIVRRLGLPYMMRGRFVGQNGNTGPADLAIPNFEEAVITVACKGFDSTGSKLTAAVTEVVDMSNVRFSHQYVFAVVDGIGWQRRMGDFRRLFALAESRRIDGLYALADMDRFEVDLVRAAQRHDLLP